MYDKNEDNKNNEKVLFKGRPNIIFSCKSIFLLFMLLGAITYIAPGIIGFVAEMQVYLINIINLPLTSYATIIISILYLIIILWIIWILLNWRATNYIITNFRVVLKKGIIIKKSYYMPFNHIQDITVSQGIINRIASVGDVVVVSAYDLSDIEFLDISNPDDIQEMIFSEVNRDNLNNTFSNRYNIHNNMPNNTFRDYNNMNNLKDNYQQPNLDNDSKYDNSNFRDDYIREDNNEISYNNESYQNYNRPKNVFNQNNRDINNQNNKDINYRDDYLDHSVDNRDINYRDDYLDHSVDNRDINYRDDFLDHSVEETMVNLDKNRFTNEKQENKTNYQSRIEHHPYKNPDKPNFNNRQRYKENNEIAKNKNDKNLSVIDIYSRKFKKHKK